MYCTVQKRKKKRKKWLITIEREFQNLFKKQTKNMCKCVIIVDTVLMLSLIFYFNHTDSKILKIIGKFYKNSKLYSIQYDISKKKFREHQYNYFSKKKINK